MKVRYYAVVCLIVPMMAQTPTTPAPKTSAEADQQAAQLIAHKRDLHTRLAPNPDFAEWEGIDYKISTMRGVAQGLRMQESAARTAAADEAAAKAKAAAAAKKK